MESYPLVHAAAGQPDGIILPPLGKGLFTDFVPAPTTTHTRPVEATATTCLLPSPDYGSCGPSARSRMMGSRASARPILVNVSSMTCSRTVSIKVTSAVT